MKTFVRENTWLNGLSHGWGNGYVVIPNGHKLHGCPYDDMDVHVNGGLTFAEMADSCDWEELDESDLGGWVVGFDTCHAWDNQDNWAKEAVENETEKLKLQLMAL